MDPGGDAYCANTAAWLTFQTGTAPTYGYGNGIRLGNGFAALHPSLKFLGPVFNAGDLSLVHRVAYPKQSRSHFDSQNYWEVGMPNNNISKEGILYRAMLESGFANTRPLTGVSIQGSLPLILRGSEAAMTNLSSVGRYDLLNLPIAQNTNALTKADVAINTANSYPFATKQNRELLQLQYQNLMNTLPLFKDISTLMNVDYKDNGNTDGDYPYSLFPNSNNNNGGWVRSANPLVTDGNKLVPPNATSYNFFTNLKACALVLNKTEAIVAGTQLDGFDNHQLEGGASGVHSDLQRRIGWAIYALWKYFSANSDQCTWDNLVIVTLSEFGRTTVMNSDYGTDHAEAGVMFVAGGGVSGGVYGCSPSDPIPWRSGPRVRERRRFGQHVCRESNLAAGYLQRCHDYRSILGEIIRDHLGLPRRSWIASFPATRMQQKSSPGGNFGYRSDPHCGRDWHHLMPHLASSMDPAHPRIRPFLWAAPVLGAVLLLDLARPVRADRVELIPSADTTLIEVAPDSNLGGACIVNAGTTQINTRNRGLFLFDLTGTLPANAVVTSAELILGVTGEPANGFITANYTLHRMLRPWGEGNKGDPNCPPDNGSSPGVGLAATPGEATWTHRFALTSSTWGAPGGAPGVDYVAGASADQLVSGTGESPYHFLDTPELRSDVQAWINDPQNNFGWMLICDLEDERGTARRFGSREDPFSPPTLVIDYTIVPEPGIFALLGLGAVSLWSTARLRKRH
jgi:uncharacterized protein (DUF1501 family)